MANAGLEAGGTLMQTMMRNFRLLAALLLAGVTAWAIAPYLTNYVSSQAVVNAPLNTVLSPIRGVITRPSDAPGTGVAAGSALVAITLEAPERRYLDQLRARRALLGETLAAVETEIRELTGLQAVMSRRIGTYRDHMLARIDAEAAEVRAEAAAARAALATAETALGRSAALAAQGHAAASRSEADALARDAAAGAVGQLAARLARIGVQRAAIATGVFVQDGWSDVPYSQQRLDEIALRLAALVAERRRAAAEAAALGPQIAAEEAQRAERELFRPSAPADGVIWKASGRAGETVVPGDLLVQMVDCSARFVEVTLPERHFADIAPGDPARVRLKGGGVTVEARVGAVLGAGAKFDHPRLAASVFEAKPDQLRVLVPLEGAEFTGVLDADPGAFCHVGRTAEVRFPRRDGGIVARLSAALDSGLAVLANGFTAAGTAVTQAPPR